MAHIDTTLATTMLEVDDKVRYDAVCKQILSERRILAEIMKGCLEEFQGISVQEIVEEYMEDIQNIMDSLDISINEAMDILKIPDEEQEQYMSLGDIAILY